MPSLTKGNPFTFPYAGNSFCIQRKQVTISGGTEYTLYDSGSNTSGIVRSIHVPCNAGLPDLTDATIKVYYNGAGSPDVTVLLSSLICADQLPLRDDLRLCTRFFSWAGPLYVAGGPQYTTFTLNWPMPWRGQIKITMTTPSAGGSQFWSNVTGQDALPNCWNSSLRFYASRHSESTAASVSRAGSVKITSAGAAYNVANFSAGDAGKSLSLLASTTMQHDALVASYQSASGVTISATDNHDIVADTSLGATYNISTHHQWLNLTGEVYIASILMGADATGVTDFMKGCVRLYADGASDACVTSSGIDNFFGFGFLCDNISDSRQALDYFNASGSSSSGKYNVGRHFYNDTLHFRDGVVGTVPNIATSAVSNAWTTVYYR